VVGRTVVYRESPVFPVYTRLGTVTTIVFEDDIEVFFIGQQNYDVEWKRGLTESRLNVMGVWPKEALASTNLQVVTNKGIYVFNLEESEQVAPYAKVIVPSYDRRATQNPLMSRVNHVLKLAARELTDPEATFVNADTVTAFLPPNNLFQADLVGQMTYRDMFAMIIQVKNLTRETMQMNKDFFMVEGCVGVGFEHDVLAPGETGLVYVVFTRSQRVPQDAPALRRDTERPLRPVE
jgi:hypothetical protein